MDASLWGIQSSDKGHMVFAGCDCSGMAKIYGTPLFIADCRKIRDNCDRFKRSLESSGCKFELYYSYKTNPVPGILKTIHSSGWGAEVISHYELWLAGKLGVNPGSIIYNGPNKTTESLKVAIENNIKLININSFGEIEKIISLAHELKTKPNIGIRVNTSVGWGNQFGFSIKTGEAFKAYKQLKDSNICNIVAIHAHLGSDIKDTNTYTTAIENICRLLFEMKHKLDITIKYLDIGGGYGVPTVRSRSKYELLMQKLFNTPFMSPDPETTPTYEEFMYKITEKIKEQCKKNKLELPVIITEPGRAVTSNAEILLTRVGNIKYVNNGLKIALVDAGINLAFPATWEYHEIFCANKMNLAKNEHYSLAGPICSPSDLYICGKKLPLLEINDLLAIMDAGAYFTSFSNNFSFPRPPVIIADNGNHQVARARETFEDMIHFDNI